MTSKISFIKNAGIYLIGNSLSNIIAFFLIPIYSKYLLPEDFGYYDISLAYVMLAIPLITAEIYVGVMRFIKEGDVSEHDIRKNISSGTLSIALFILLLILLWYLDYVMLSIDYFELIGVFALATVFQRYYIYICRGLGFNKVFVVSGIICTFFTAVLNYVFILYYDMCIVSLYLAAIIGILAQIVYLEWHIKLRGIFDIQLVDVKRFKKLIFFTFPLSIGSLLFFFLMYYNRTVIEGELGLSANGNYAIAAKFTVAIGLLTSAFTMSWQDTTFSIGLNRKNFNNISKGIKYYMIFLTFGGSMIIFMVHFLFPYIIDDNYSDSYQVISLSILATIIAALGDFLSQTLLAVNKSKIILYTSIFATLLNLILVKYLVKKFGINGVNISLIIVYSLSLIIRLFYLRKKLNFNINSLLFPSLLIYIIIICIVYSTNNSYYAFIGFVITAILFLILFGKELIHLYSHFVSKKTDK